MNDIDNCLNQACQMIDMHDQIGARAMLLRLEIHLSNMNDVQHSFFSFQKARICEFLGDYNEMICSANDSISYAQNNEQKYYASKILFSAYLKMFEDNNENKSLIELAEKNIDKAIEYANLCECKGLVLEPLRFKSWIARCRNDYETAIKILNEAARIADELHINSELSIVVCQIADVLSISGKKNLALSEYYRAERYAHEGGDYDFYCRVVIHRLAMMFELETENAELGTKAKADIINIAGQKI